ncbi:NAD(P)-dependent oxidoreductase [Anaerosinus massiliensis]|uniref:NAD(P)-dependent oxidoreductase n=1 Tax=Massilibacillus massiliensis TaxID=1806837 RepID=UPI000A56EC5F|nr:NAD(P)-dependent oxidoreductase [Massilibacillus massiliensis]
MKIGFIGLGNMGKPMALNLLKAQYDVTICDVNQAVVEEFKAVGAKAAATPAELAKYVDVVITMLPNGKIVEQVVNGEQGILRAADPGLCILDMSSVAPGFTQQLAALAAAQQVDYMDAPVSGGVKGATDGTLTIMAGGAPAIVSKCRPILETLGKKIYEVGSVGAGDAIKMVNNLLLAVNMAAAAEAFTLGTKIGLDPQIMLDVIGTSSGNSYALQAKMPNFVFQGKFEPGFMIDLQYKDLELAVQTAKETQVPLMLGNVVQQLYGQSQAAGLGKEDISAIIKPLEQLTGIQVRK